MSLNTTSTHLLNTSQDDDLTTYLGSLFPIFHNPLSEETFSNTQTNPSLAQIEVISSRSIT